MPIRSIPRNARSVTGRLPVHGQGAVCVESTLERDFAQLVQFPREFVSLEEQPVRISVPAPGRHYVPDFLVTWSDRRPDLVEVKYQAEIDGDNGRLTHRFSAAQRFAQERGWRFIVATERDIRTPLLSNVKFLLPFRRREVDPGQCARLLGCVREYGTMSAASLLKTAFPKPEAQVQALPALWHLIASFRIAADLQAPLTMDAGVWLGDVAHG